MNLGTISYWFSEAFGSMRKNIKSVLIAVSTMLVTMLIIAVGYAIVKNSNYIVEQKQEASSKILAYLSPDEFYQFCLTGIYPLDVPIPARSQMIWGSAPNPEV